MKTLVVKIAAIICLALPAGIAHAAETEGCTTVRSAIGAVLGGALGTLVFPGVGTAWGAALGGASTCGYDSAKRWWT